MERAVTRVRADLGRLALRAVLSVVFIGHGVQTTFGALGGALSPVSREPLVDFTEGLEKQRRRFRAQETLTRSCNR